MARPETKALDNAPMDTLIYNDAKIKRLGSRFRGHKGDAIGVYINLVWSKIYAEGYYIPMNEDLPAIIADELDYDESFIVGVIDACVDVGLFDSGLYSSAKILTSLRIQKTYNEEMERRKRKRRVQEYSLLGDSQEPIVLGEPIKLDISEGMDVSSEETRVSSRNQGVSRVFLPEIKRFPPGKEEPREKERTKEKELPEENSSPSRNVITQRLMYILFFTRAMKKPGVELRRMISWYSSRQTKPKGRLWSRMSDDEKIHAAKVWSESYTSDDDRPRFQPGVLRAWQRIYDIVCVTATVPMIIEMLSDDLKIGITTCTDGRRVLNLHCTEMLQGHIEKHISQIRPVIFDDLHLDGLVYTPAK